MASTSGNDQYKLGGSEIVGKWVHVEGIGVGRVAQFHKVKSKFTASKHSVDFSLCSEAPAQYQSGVHQLVLRRRRSHTWGGSNKGVEFDVCSDDVAAEYEKCRETGFSKVSEFRNCKSAGFTDKASYDQWKRSGFDDKATFELAKKMGVSNKAEYEEVQSGGFSDKAEFERCKKLGFNQKQAYEEFLSLGFGDKGEYDTFCTMGFTVKDDFRTCIAMGFDSKAAFESCKKMGFDKKEEYDDCVALGLQSKTEYDAHNAKAVADAEEIKVQNSEDIDSRDDPEKPKPPDAVAEDVYPPPPAPETTVSAEAAPEVEGTTDARTKNSALSEEPETSMTSEPSTQPATSPSPSPALAGPDSTDATSEEKSTVQRQKEALEAQHREKYDEAQNARAEVSSTNNNTKNYRGAGWDYLIGDRPAFNAYSFLPTPLAMRPRTRDEEPQAIEEDETEHELRYEPPDGADVMLCIRDRFGEYRGYITSEGECVNNRDKTIGWINREEGTAGSLHEEYLGTCIDQLSGDECVVEDALDERCGSINLGTATIHDNSGSTVAEFEQDGTVVGNHGSGLGKFEGFTYPEIRTVALYLMLIDPGMLNEIEG